MQYILLCLQDTDPYAEPKNNYTYVQCSRRRFSKEDAEDRMKSIAPSRHPVIVPVHPVPLDSEGYPTA